MAFWSVCDVHPVLHAPREKNVPTNKNKQTEGIKKNVNNICSFYMRFYAISSICTAQHREKLYCIWKLRLPHKASRVDAKNHRHWRTKKRAAAFYYASSNGDSVEFLLWTFTANVHAASLQCEHTTFVWWLKLITALQIVLTAFEEANKHLWLQFSMQKLTRTILRFTSQSMQAKGW